MAVIFWHLYRNLGHQSQPSFRGNGIFNRIWGAFARHTFKRPLPATTELLEVRIISHRCNWLSYKGNEGTVWQMFRLPMVTKKSEYIYIFVYVCLCVCVYQANTTRPLGINRLWSDCPAVNGRRKEREEREWCWQKSIGRTRASLPGMIFAFQTFPLLSYPVSLLNDFPRNLYGKRGVSHINCGSWIQKPQNDFVEKIFFSFFFSKK